MQYLLTQEEKDNLIPLADMELAKLALEEARKAILKASNFICVNDHENENWCEYDVCDDCPCSSIEDGKDYKQWELICDLRKEYSQ